MVFSGNGVPGIFIPIIIPAELLEREGKYVYSGRAKALGKKLRTSLEMKIAGSIAVFLCAFLVQSPSLAQDSPPKATRLQLALWYPRQLAGRDHDVRGARFSLISAWNRDISGLDLGLGALKSRRVRGIQAAGFSSIAEGDVDGIQVCLGFCRSKGNFRGVQVAGFFGNPLFIQPVESPGDFTGIQIGGMLGAASGDFIGIQVSAAVNEVDGDFTGIQVGWAGSYVGGGFTGAQLGLIGNLTAGKLTGFQTGGFAAGVGGNLAGFQIAIGGSGVSGDSRGVQLGGVYSGTEGSLSGVQIGLIGKTGRDLSGFQLGILLGKTGGKVTGAQVGVVNIAERVKGVQIGLVNYCRRMNGVQVGIYNFIHEGALPFFPVVNASFSPGGDE